MQLTDSEEIRNLIEGYENDVKAIKEESLRICWWMRGSISYNDSMQLSQQDREIINMIIKDNTEAGKKAGVHVF